MYHLQKILWVFVQCCNREYVCCWLEGFVILLSVMHIMSKFRLKLESRSFSSLMWELIEEISRCNIAKSCFVTITLLKLFKSW